MESLKNKYFWAAIPYTFAVGILYLWGYWSTFQINIFAYADISSLVKVAIIPLGSVFFFTLIGMSIAEFSFARHLPDGGGKNTRLGIFLNKFKFVFALIYWLIIAAVIFSKLPGKWLVLPMLILPFPYLALKGSSFLIEIRSDSMRSIIVMAISLLPAYSFCSGKTDAKRIEDGVEYKYIESIGELKKAKYIGHVSEYEFFVSQDNQTIISQKSNESPLALKLYKKTDPTPDLTKEAK